MARGRTDKEIIEAMQRAAGNLTYAAKSLGISRDAIYQRMRKSPTLTTAIDDLREGVVDLAESIMQRRLHAEDLTAAMYVLNNHPAAKKRGWGPRTEVTGAEGAALSVIILDK